MDAAAFDGHGRVRLHAQGGRGARQERPGAGAVRRLATQIQAQCTACRARGDGLRVRLPEDYRGFLLNVGNGGAGPHYGVFRLGEIDGLSDDDPWREGEFVGVLRDPWPHRGPWNLPEEELHVPAGLPPDELEAVFNARDLRYWSEALIAGAIPICHHGCALRDWLVVTGPEAGQVWHDFRADGRGLRPCEGPEGRRQTFMDWYLDWLNGALRELNVKFALNDFA